MTKDLFALVVEDEKPLAIIFAEAMKMAGYRAEVVHDGQAALNRLSEAVPHIVILDINLPLVSGDEVFRSIKADPRLVGTKVLVVTANVLAADELEWDADLVLVKPVSFVQLRDMAERLGMSVT